MMEEALSDIERLADLAARPSGELTAYDSDLPPHFSAVVAPIVRRLRVEVARIATAFGVEPRHASRAAHVRALVASELVRIEDSRPVRLRGYGGVAPDLSPVLDPMLSELRAGFERIDRALGGG
jgi:hypothetical protein